MFDRLALLVRDWPKPLESGRELSVPNLVHLFSEFSNYGDCCQSSYPFPVFVRLFGDDPSGRRKIFFATPEVGSRCCLQIIEVVKEDVVEFSHICIDIAREGNVED